MGLFVPCDLVRMSLIPAVSMTARIASREITPVPGAAGGVGKRLDPSVIEETAEVEDDLLDAGGLGLVGDLLADLCGLRHAVALGLELDCRCGGHGLGGAVVDDLRVQVVEAAVDGQARPLRRAAHGYPHAPVPLRAAFFAIGALDHAVVFAPLPALPALRLIFSPRYMTPLPL